MGGFVIRTQDEDEWILDDGRVVTPKGILEMARLEQLPEVNVESIHRRSKTDVLSKAVVVIQATWMLIQILGRKFAQLPITLLEINTVAHVGVALSLYVVWWKKPQDVEEYTEISFDASLAAFMSS